MSIVVAIALAAAQPASPVADPCRYDRMAMLALDQQHFDQDPDQGWRTLAAARCHDAAADLIRDWRTAHQSREPILFWHEGQMRAFAGQIEPAIDLFGRSRKPASDDTAIWWNPYVDGSIAFLRGDRAALEAARGRLAALDRPAGFSPPGADGKPTLMAWPPNLAVLDGFIRCWGQSYRQAYGCPSIAHDR